MASTLSLVSATMARSSLRERRQWATSAWELWAASYYLAAHSMLPVRGKQSKIKYRLQVKISMYMWTRGYVCYVGVGSFRGDEIAVNWNIWKTINYVFKPVKCHAQWPCSRIPSCATRWWPMLPTSSAGGNCASGLDLPRPLLNHSCTWYRWGRWIMTREDELWVFMWYSLSSVSAVICVSTMKRRGQLSAVAFCRLYENCSECRTHTQNCSSESVPIV